MASAKKPIVLAKPTSNPKLAIAGVTKTTTIRLKSTIVAATKIEKLAKPLAPTKPFAVVKSPAKPTIVKRVPDSTTKSTVSATVKPPTSSIKSTVTVVSPGRAVITRSAPKSPISLPGAAKLRASPAKTVAKPATAYKAVDGQTKFSSPARAAPPKFGSAIEAKSPRPTVAKPKPMLAVKSTAVKPSSGVAKSTAAIGVAKSTGATGVVKSTVASDTTKSTAASGITKSTVTKPRITSKTSAVPKAPTAKPTSRVVAAVKSIRTRPSKDVSTSVTRIREEGAIEVRDADSTTVDVRMGEFFESPSTPTTLCSCESSQPQFDEERAYVVAEQILSVIAATEDTTVALCPAAANESCIIDMTLVDVELDECSNADSNGDLFEVLSADLKTSQVSGETDNANDRCDVESTGEAEPAEADRVEVAETHEAVESVRDDGDVLETVGDSSPADCPPETVFCEDETVESTTALELEGILCDSCELIVNDATTGEFTELSQSSAEEIIEAAEQTDELKEALVDDCYEENADDRMTEQTDELKEALVDDCYRENADDRVAEQTDELREALVDDSYEENADDRVAEDVAINVTVNNSYEKNQDDQSTESVDESNEVLADDENCQTNASNPVEDVDEPIELSADDCEPIPEDLVLVIADEPIGMSDDDETNTDNHISECVGGQIEDCDTNTDEGAELTEDYDPDDEEVAESNDLPMDDAYEVNMNDRVSEDADQSVDGMPIDIYNEAGMNDSDAAITENTCEADPAQYDCESNAQPNVTNPVEDPIKVSSSTEPENEEPETPCGSEVSAENAEPENDDNEIGNDEFGSEEMTAEADGLQMNVNENHFTKSEETSENSDGFVMVLEANETTPDDVMSLASAESVSYTEATDSSKASQISDCYDQECLRECQAADEMPERDVESHLGDSPCEKHYGDENVEPDHVDEEGFRKIRQKKNRKKNKKSERMVVAKNKELEQPAASEVNDDYFEEQYHRSKNPRKWRKPKTIYNAPHWKYFPDEM